MMTSGEFGAFIAAQIAFAATRTCSGMSLVFLVDRIYGTS